MTVWYGGGDEAEARDTDEPPFSDKPILKRCGKTYKLTTGSSNLKAQTQRFVLKRGRGRFCGQS